MAGGLTYRLQDRPSFGLDLSLDRLKLDSYLPAVRWQVAVERRSGEPEGNGDGARDVLALLNSFDANMTLRAGQLVYLKTPFNGVEADLSLVGGRLTVRRARVAELHGVSLSLNAVGSNFADLPAFEGNLELVSNDLSDLLDLEFASTSGRLGPVDLKVALDGDMEGFDFELSGDIVDSRLNANGKVSKPFAGPVIDVSVRAEHPSLAGLFNALGIVLLPAEGADTGLAIEGRLKGGSDSLQLDVDLNADGGSLHLDGDLWQLDAQPGLDLAVRVQYRDLGELLGLIGLDRRQLPGQISDVALSAAVRGTSDRLDFSELGGRVGPVNIAGTAQLALQGARPFLRANLATGEIIVDALLPPRAGDGEADRSLQAAARSAAASPTGERWSREPIDLRALSAMDADLTLSAPGVSFGNFRLAEPRLALDLKGGRLKIHRLSGGLLQGRLELSARLDGGALPALDLDLALAEAGIRETLGWTMGIEALDGLLDVRGRLRSSGRSIWDLVSGLLGEFTVTAKDGVARGLNLEALSRALGKLDDADELRDVLRQGFADGETALTSVRGTWVVDGGVARTDDTVATLPAGRASLTGTIDLAAWLVDLECKLRLTDRPELPPLALALNGPIGKAEQELKSAALEKFVIGRIQDAAVRRAIREKDKRDRPMPNLLGAGRADGTASETGPASPGTADQSLATDGDAGAGPLKERKIR